MPRTVADASLTPSPAPNSVTDPPIRILPSLLSCDFARIAEELFWPEHDPHGQGNGDWLADLVSGGTTAQARREASGH